MTDRPPSAQLSALLWLRNRNGEGVFDRNHVLVASGERAPFMRATWNRLAKLELVELINNRRRIRVTDDGAALDLTNVREPERIHEDFEEEDGPWY